MAIKISIQKPNNLGKALEKAKEEAANSGVLFSGNEQSGQGEGFGFMASYIVQDSNIVITVNKKPFFITESKLVKEVGNFWEEYLAEEKRA